MSSVLPTSKLNQSASGIACIWCAVVKATPCPCCVNSFPLFQFDGNRISSRIYNSTKSANTTRNYKTRDNSILDWLFTKKFKLFNVSQLHKVSSTVHYTFLAKPASPSLPACIVKKRYAMHNMQYSAWRALGRWLPQKDWTPIRNASSYELKFQLLMSELCNAINNFNPQRILKKHPASRPWITNNIKLWIGKRQCAFHLHGKGSDVYRHWNNEVQSAIKQQNITSIRTKLLKLKK